MFLIAYGTQIGKKFSENGQPLSYPGNTIVSDLTKNNSAYPVMRCIRQMMQASPLASLFIFMPESSYHMTVIRGMNDHVRDSAYWPPDLKPNAPFLEADEKLKNAYASVPVPQGFHMRFTELKITGEDARVRLAPESSEAERTLRAYRDAIADALHFRLPGHDEYTFHMTVAYTRLLPDAKGTEALDALTREAQTYLNAQPSFFIGAPYVAYYDNMLEFPTVRRKAGKEEAP